MDTENISANGSINQLVECPHCGERFELSETFRAHFESEKRREINAALQENEKRIYAEAEKDKQESLEKSADQIKELELQIKTDQKAQQKREAEIRAEMEKASQAKLTESAEELKALQAQMKSVQKVQEKREAKIRADLEKANQAKLDESAVQVKKLETQIKADQKAQEKREADIRAEAEKASQNKLAQSAEQVKVLEAQIKAGQKAQEKREAEIRAEMEKASQAKLTESAEELKALQAQMKSAQKVQEKREAKIRADLEKANQAKLDESEQKVIDLQARLLADRESQDKREAIIRAEMEKASQEKLTESAEQVKALEAKLQADQKAQEDREAEIRAEMEHANKNYELERKMHTIEKTRLEKQMADMQRQLRQSSAELQGEVLEVYLKQQLVSSFPFDKISDIRRGRKGADLTQEVVDRQLGACGMVVWEAKRTKHWNDTWLAKIKEDADRVGAHLRVIVSEALPKEIRVFDLRDGVWVSSVEGAIPLAMALRSQLIQGTRLQRAVQGKGLKMDEVYNYLTSPRFSERIQRIVDTWVALEEQVSREERSMQRQWKERRKQLERLRDSTIEMYTDFSAIFGQEIAQVPGLQMEALPPGDATEVIDI